MFLKISLPQLFAYEKSVNVRLGWKGDWAEVLMLTIHLGEVYGGQDGS